MRVDIPIGLQLCSKPVSCAAVEEGCTGGLIIEVFDNSNKVGADVVLVHGYPQSCMPNPVESLVEVFELLTPLPSGAALTPAISPISGRLTKSGNVQVQRICSLP